MKWKFISAVAIAACVTTACSDSSNPLEPSSLPSAQSPSSPASETSVTGPSFCTNLDNCPGGSQRWSATGGIVQHGDQRIEVVVRGSRQSGAVLADGVGQVPPGTQPAPPGDFVTAPPGVDGKLLGRNWRCFGPRGKHPRELSESAIHCWWNSRRDKRVHQVLRSPCTATGSAVASPEIGERPARDARRPLFGRHVSSRGRRRWSTRAREHSQRATSRMHITRVIAEADPLLNMPPSNV